MADASDIPVIGPWLDFGLSLFGRSGKPPAFTFTDGEFVPGPGLPTTFPGRTRRPDAPGRVPGTPSPLSDPLNAAVIGFLSDWTRRQQEAAGLAARSNQPVKPPDLPSPIVDIPPPVIGEPAINLPIDLPQVIVSPPGVITEIPIAEPPPLEVDLEPVHVEAVPIPQRPPYVPSKPAGVGSRPAVTAASTLRIDPVLAGVLLQQVVPGVGSSFANVLTRTPNLARTPSPVSPIGAGPAGPAQPGAPGGTQIPLDPQLKFSDPATKLADPLTLAAPQKLGRKPDGEQCKCDEKEKKKREPKPPRTKCYKGTFRQHAKGISYSRGEEIPCVPQPRTKAAPKAKSVKNRAVSAATKYAKRKRAPSMGELARDVFGIGI